MRGNTWSRLVLCGALLSRTHAFAQQTPVITGYPIPAANSASSSITNGPDGALWFTESASGAIGRITTSGTVTEYPAQPANGPGGIVTGSDGALWFADSHNNIGRIDTTGGVTLYAIPTPFAQPYGITAGPDGALWFTELAGNNIGRITVAGVITEYPIPTASASPFTITVGPDGALWFTEQWSSKIGRITTAGAFTEYPTLTLASEPEAIAAGPDGALWFTELYGHNVGRISMAGTLTEYEMPSAGYPNGIAAGPDGALWFTEGPSNRIGRITTTGVISEYSVPTAATFPFGITAGPDGAMWFAEDGFSAGVPNMIGRVSIFSSGTPLQITTSLTLPLGDVGTAYYESLTAIGGAPPYAWSLTSGALPAGLSLSSVGQITGTPTTVGTQTFTLTATDVNSSSVSQITSLTIGQAGCAYAVSSGGQVIFPAVGAAGSFIVTAGVGCAWSVSGVPAWLTIVSGAAGTGNGTVNYVVGPNASAAVLSGTLTIAGVGFAVSQNAGLQPSSGVMPHLTAEGGWRTTFTLVNKDSFAAGTQLGLLNDSGEPLVLPLTFPQQPSLPPVTEPSVEQTIPGNGSLIVEASGPANVPYVQGSAQMTSVGAVDGFAIFHFDPSGQEAVVPLQPSAGADGVLAFDNTNGVLTGIAAEMTSILGGSTVSVILRDDTGAQIGTGMESITLSQDAHTSFVLSTQFPVTANIRGTVELIPPCTGYGNGLPSMIVCSSLSVLGIRYTPPGTLTTITAFPEVVNSEGAIAHVASGSGWQTTFILVNTIPIGSAQTELSFFDDNGNPLWLPLTFPQSGMTTNAASVTAGLAGGASLWIQTSGPLGSALLTGSAQLSTNNFIGAAAIYRYTPNGQEASVAMESRNAGTYLLAFDNTNGTATGLAISAVSTQPVSVPVILRDDGGKQIGTGSIPLAANGHLSQMLTALFPETANIRGTVEFDTPAGAQISVLGIRSPPALTFTTLPALAN